MSFKSTTSAMREEAPYPIETVEVNDAEMAQLAIDYINNSDLTHYVVSNVQDPNNRTYYEWTGGQWVKWNDLKQSNRWCIPADQVKSYNLTTHSANMGQAGDASGILFTPKEQDELGIIRLTPDALWVVTGLLCPTAACRYKQIIIINTQPIGGFNIQFFNNNAFGNPVNRFLLYTNMVELIPQAALVLRYDNVDLRWRQISFI